LLQDKEIMKKIIKKKVEYSAKNAERGNFFKKIAKSHNFRINKLASRNAFIIVSRIMPEVCEVSSTVVNALRV